MKIRFMVPWRSDHGHRAKLWQFCQAWWAKECPDISIVEGDPPPGAFNRSAAINAAADGAWDIGIVLDADVLVPGAQVYEAIRAADRTGRLSLPFDQFLGMTPNMTQRIMAGEAGDWANGCRFYSPHHESSVVVVPRPLWDTVGGFDERFVGWGQEDVAFAHSARVLGGGINRVMGRVYHLWHERSPERNQVLPHWRANQQLGNRYRKAVTEDDIRALLEERDRERTVVSV